jgi:hypothetical protein
LLDKIEILEDFFFRKRRTAYGLGVASPTDKVLPGWLQIQMGIVKGMIGLEPGSILVPWGVPQS